MIFSSHFPCCNLSLELGGGASSFLPGGQEDHWLLHCIVLWVNATTESSRKQEILRVLSSSERHIHMRRRGGGRLQTSTQSSHTERALTSERTGSDCGLMYIIIQSFISSICLPVVQQRDVHSSTWPGLFGHLCYTRIPVQSSL